MDSPTCIGQNISKIGLGLTFLLFGLGLVALGVTIIPVFGLILAAPVLGIGAFFLLANLDKECQIIPSV